MAVIENLFVALFTVSVSTSIALIPLLLLSPLARRHYPAKWCCILWLLIAIRLLVPFNPTFSESPVQITFPNEITQPITGAPMLPAVGQEPTAAAGSDALPGVATSSPITLLQLAALVWLAGVIIYLAIQTGFYLRFAKRSRRFARTVASQTNDILHSVAVEMNLKREPAVFVNPMIQTPVLVGLVHPVIYLPSKNYSPDELLMVIRHELAHYKRHDVWYKLVFLLVCAVHWFNPVVWVLTRQAGKDIEIACDDVVVNRLDKSQRAVYGQTILNGVPRTKHMAPALSTQLSSSKRTMKRRIINLFDFRMKRRGAMALCATVLCIGLAGSLVACVPQQQGESVPPDSLTLPASESTLSQSSTDSPQSTPSVPVQMDTVEHGGQTWYVVENESQLRSIAFDDESLSKNYIQMGDIALTGDWTPIGDGDHPFTGTYTGDGYHISGLQIAGPQVNNAGLFGVVENGVVYNVTLLQPTMSPLDSRSEIRVVALAMGAVTKSNLVLMGEQPASSGDAPAVTWDTVTIRYYEDGTPYVKDNFTNHTDEAIVGYTYAMLAYDRDGNPIKADWWEFDTDDDSYLNICKIDSDRGPDSSYYVAPGGTLDVRGGWTVGAEIDSDGRCTMEYVLVCFSEIVFEDGRVWQNPEYSTWMEMYNEKPVDVKTLESYYPFTQTIND